MNVSMRNEVEGEQKKIERGRHNRGGDGGGSQESVAKGSGDLHVCMCTTCVPAGPGSQQRVSDPLELLFWPIMRHMWVLRSEPRSSARAASTLNLWAESCLSSSNTFAFSKVLFLGWEDSSVGKTFAIQAKRTWVQIPRTHVRSWAWPYTPVISALRRWD